MMTAAQIRDGNPGMPSFGTMLKDSDIANVVSYLHEDKCCFEGEDPPANPWYRALAQRWPVQNGLFGGTRGAVRIANGSSGDSLEGIAVQLIAPNGVRTTVYTKEDGTYEFPKMQAGSYTLRLPMPLEFKAYRRSSIHIDDPTKLDDIVLERISDSTEALPPTPAIESQLSGAELLWNLPGTAQEKEDFRRACGSGCHSYPQILRNRYDERSWRLIVARMFHYSGAPLINRQKAGIRGSAEAEENIAKWLARVRGPESKDGPLRIFPRLGGASTRVIVTEYELPRVLLSAHDVAADSKGNIWYTSHKTPYIGKLDPHTGIVTEYAVPLTPGAMPGTHRVQVGKNDVVWLSENWAHNLTSFDPRTEKFTQMQIKSEVSINSPGFGNFALAPDGFIWWNQDNEAEKIDPETGKVVQRYPMKLREGYDNLVSPDGKFWAAGSPASTGGNSAELLDIQTGEMRELNTGARLSGPRRGGFDPYQNPWFGGATGSLVELDAKADRIREYWPPTPYSPYTDFYEAMPDKNGEVWAGILHGREFVRFNPHTGRWIEYAMPEPFAHDRRTWIDNSTRPVTVWYVDYQGYIVRIQPLE